jgi:hypothetical protein
VGLGADAPRQRRAIQRVGHVPEVTHFQQRGHRGVEGRQQPHHPPGQRACAQRAVGRQPALLPGDLGQCGQPVLARHRVAGEMQAFEAPAHPFRGGLGHADESPGQIGQVGPGVRGVQSARPGHMALRQLLHDHLVQPGAVAGAKEVPSAYHHRPNPARARRLRQLLLQVDADAAFFSAGPLWRVRCQHRGHILAEVVDIAREQQDRPQPCRHIDGGLHQARRLCAPGGGRVGRIHRMHDHPGAGSRTLQRGRVGGLGQHPLDAGHRRRCRAARAPLRQHAPARRRECLRHRAAQSTACPQNQNRVCHDRSP